MLSDYIGAERLIVDAVEGENILTQVAETQRRPFTFVYLSTGILDSVFDSQVLPVLREMSLRKWHVIHISSEPFLVRRTESWVEKKSILAKESFISIYQRKLPELNRLCLKYDAHRISGMLKTCLGAPVIIHARGHVNAWKACHFKNLWKVSADLRGAIWDEKPRTEPGWFKVLRMTSSRDFFLEIEKEVVRSAHRLLCVSEAFKKHLWSLKPLSEPELIPTFVDDSAFAFSARARKIIRSALNIRDEQPVFVFTAGGAEWQMAEDLLQWCGRISDIWPESFFLILSLVPEKIRAIANKWLHPECFLIKNVSYSEVGQYLSAADIGLLFRDNSWTNRVAAPTKFSEYACSGLPVCLTKGIGDTERYIRKSGAGLTIDSMHELPRLDDLKKLLKIPRRELSLRGLRAYGQARWLKVLAQQYEHMADTYYGQPQPEIIRGFQ